MTKYKVVYKLFGCVGHFTCDTLEEAQIKHDATKVFMDMLINEKPEEKKYGVMNERRKFDVPFVDIKIEENKGEDE